jgi:hypothetical protein
MGWMVLRKEGASAEAEATVRKQAKRQKKMRDMYAKEYARRLQF